MKKNYSIGAVLLIIFMLFSCEFTPFGTWDNELDNNGDNFQGYETLSDPDSIQTITPDDSILDYPVLISDAILDASYYQFQIAEDENFESIILDKTSSENILNPDFAGSADKTYYWHVRAKQDTKIGEWSNTGTFQIVGFTSYGPYDQTSTNDPTPEFYWSEFPQARGYQFRSALTEPGLSTAELIDLDSTGYTPENALESTVPHFWQVRAVTEEGLYSAWTPPSSITIIWNLINSQLPEDGTEVTELYPSFSWTNVESALSYQFRLAESDAFLEDAEIITLTENSCALSEAIENGKTYYWQLRCEPEENVYTSWTAPLSFIMNWGEVSGLSPAGETSLTDTTPTLSWTGITEAQSYQIRFATSSSELENIQPVDILSGTSYTPDTAWENNQTHYWQVRARNADGIFGVWSSFADFTIGWGSISGQTPANGTVLNTCKPQLSWDPVSLAESYEIRVAESPEELEDATIYTRALTNYTPDSNLTNLKSHYWQVRAKDSYGAYTAWSSPINFAIEWGEVAGLSPDSATTGDLTPDFSWTAVDQAEEYNLRLAYSESALESPAFTTVTGSNSFTPSSSLENNRNIYWQVQAVNSSGGTGPWSDPASFQIIWGNISGLTPASGSTTENLSPEFSWSPVDGASLYEIRYADDEDDLLSASISTSETGSFTPPTALTNLTTCYWQVRAKDSDGQYGSWSSSTLDIHWGDITGLSPSGGSSSADTTPVLSWNEVTNAAGYELRSALSQEDLDDAVPVTGISEETFTPSTPWENNKTHYWQVRAKSADNQYGNWSSPVSLDIAWGEISGLSPGDNASVTSLLPGLTWDNVGNAEDYEIRLSENETGLNEAAIHTLESNSFTPDANFNNFQEYFWQVRAQNSDGVYTSWSSPISFNIHWGDITGLNPSGGSSSADTTPVLSWNEVTNAAGYELRSALSQEALDDAVPVTGISEETFTPSTPWENNKTHYWQVRAKSADNQYGNWSSPVSLDIAWGEISGLSPVTGTTTTDTTPMFEWNEVSGAASYKMRYATSLEDLETASDVTGGTAYNTYSASTPFNNRETYYWQVCATDSGGQDGPWYSPAATLTFRWGDVSGLSPSSGTLSDRTPELSWDSADGAVSYELRTALSVETLEEATAIENIGSTNYSISSPLENNQTYYWQVRAKDSDSQFGYWSDYGTFTIEWGDMSLIYPSNDADCGDLTPAFSWNPLEDVDHYELQLAENTADLDSSTVYSSSSASFTPSVDLTNETTYYWHVRAVATDNIESAWSSLYHINLTSNLAVGDIGPAGGTIVYYDSGNEYSWDYLEASDYDLGDARLWGTSGVEISGPQQAIDYGPTNTAIILTIDNQIGFPARDCDDYSQGGYDDWFLPSQNELYHVIKYGKNTRQAHYWSSSPHNSNQVHGVSKYYNYGVLNYTYITDDKTDENYVRPVRRF